SRRALIENDLSKINELIKTLEKPDAEIKLRITELVAAQRTIQTKIQSASFDLEEEYDTLFDKLFEELQVDLLTKKIKAMELIDSNSVFKEDKTTRVVYLQVEKDVLLPL